MDFNQILAVVMPVCFGLGAADYVLGGRFGLSVEFENGLMTCGRLLLCMGGFMVLAPELCAAVVIGKAVAGATAFGSALVLTPKLPGRGKKNKRFPEPSQKRWHVL